LDDELGCFDEQHLLERGERLEIAGELEEGRHHLWSGVSVD